MLCHSAWDLIYILSAVYDMGHVYVVGVLCCSGLKQELARSSMPRLWRETTWNPPKTSGFGPSANLAYTVGTISYRRYVGGVAAIRRRYYPVPKMPAPRRPN